MTETSTELSSVGSRLHGVLNRAGEVACRPCIWFRREVGCSKGFKCRYCHVCPAGEIRGRKREKLRQHRADMQPSPDVCQPVASHEQNEDLVKTPEVCQPEASDDPVEASPDAECYPGGGARDRTPSPDYNYWSKSGPTQPLPFLSIPVTVIQPFLMFIPDAQAKAFDSSEGRDPGHAPGGFDRHASEDSPADGRGEDKHDESEAAGEKDTDIPSLGEDASSQSEGSFEEPWPSCGSAGHPTSCGPPCKYNTKPKGCKDGPSCNHCHLCRWSAPPRLGRPLPVGREWRRAAQFS